MSRIGNKSIALTDKVKVSESNGLVTVEGPKGKLEFTLPTDITVAVEGSELVVSRPSDHRRHKAMHGTARSILNNMVKGVNDGFVKELEIQGVGFRAKVAGKNIDLSLGKSHPIIHPIPEGVTVTVTENTKVKVEVLINKQSVSSQLKFVDTIHQNHIRAKVFAMLVNTFVVKQVSLLSNRILNNKFNTLRKWLKLIVRMFVREFTDVSVKK